MTVTKNARQLGGVLFLALAACGGGTASPPKADLDALSKKTNQVCPKKPQN